MQINNMLHRFLAVVHRIRNQVVRLTHTLAARASRAHKQFLLQTVPDDVVAPSMNLPTYGGQKTPNLAHYLIEPSMPN